MEIESNFNTGKKNLYEKEFFKGVVSKSCSYTDLVRNLGLRPYCGNRITSKKYIELYKLDISHFTFGREKKNNFKSKISLKEILVENSLFSNTTILKNKLFKSGVKKRKCESCGQGEVWNGKKMALHLDHINGVNNDNRIENLRILCPNCHSTTKTYGGKNARKNKKGTAFQKFSYEEDLKRNTCKCGSKKYKRSKFCLKCSHESQRKVKRPDLKLLKKEVEEFGYSATGRKYGVSDSAIRKWIKKGT